MVDDNHIEARFARLELQPQLLLNGGEEIGRSIVWKVAIRA
jgi:hypothetical protein